VLTGFGDDEGTEGATVTAHIADRTGAEATVVSAVQDNQIRRAGGDDRDDRSLAIRFGRTKRTDFRADRGGGDEKGGHGEDVAHGLDYWASLREGWVCWRKVRVGANSPSLWPTMFSVT